MKLEVNIEKKYAFAILSLLFLIGIGVYAYTYTSQIPNPGHGGDTVLVNVNGVEMSLQDAITLGKLGNSSVAGGGSIKGLTLLANDETGSSTITIPPNTFSKILITTEFFYYGHGSVIPSLLVNGAVVKTFGALTTGGGYGVSASDSLIINGGQNSNTPVQISYSISGTTVTTTNLRVWGVVNSTESQSSTGVPSGTLCGLSIVGDICEVQNLNKCEDNYPSVSCPAGYTQSIHGRIVWDGDYYKCGGALVTGARLKICVKN